MPIDKYPLARLSLEQVGMSLSVKVLGVAHIELFGRQQH